MKWRTDWLRFNRSCGHVQVKRATGAARWRWPHSRLLLTLAPAFIALLLSKTALGECSDDSYIRAATPLLPQSQEAFRADTAGDYSHALSLANQLLPRWSALRSFGGECGAQAQHFMEEVEGLKAASLYHLKKYADAIPLYRDLAVSCQTCKRTDRALWYNQLGLMLQFAERLDEAEQAYLSAINLDPDDPSPYLRLGETYVERGRTQAAIAAYRKALQVAGSDPQGQRFATKAREAIAALSVPSPAAPDNSRKAPTTPPGPKLRATGTGFAVTSSGHVATNYHVVANCKEVRAAPADGLASKASVAAVDRQNDLALLKLSTPAAEVATFREGNPARLGEAVIVLGFPLYGMVSKDVTLTTGNISSLVGLRDDSREIQITAPVQPGNSGGPLMDASGNVIGMVNAKLNAIRAAQATGDIPQNINFAIKASVIRAFLDSKQIAYRTEPSADQLKTADIGDGARKFTLRIECWN